MVKRESWVYSITGFHDDLLNAVYFEVNWFNKFSRASAYLNLSMLDVIRFLYASVCLG
jgi:hypothetical protein